MITPLQVVTGSGVFCFAYLQEVTAHGEAKPKTLPASRMPGTDSGRVVPQASACPPTEPERGQRGLSQLVFQGRLDPGTAPSTTAAGTFLPGLCGQGVAHPCHGGGPCYPLPWRLGLVCQSGQSPEPVQVPPRPEDRPGTSRKQGKREPALRGRRRGRLRLRGRVWASVCAYTCGRRHGGKAAALPPGRKSFGGFSPDLAASSFARKSPPWRIWKGGFACASQRKAK